jgi:acid phosphatase (class A)
MIRHSARRSILGMAVLAGAISPAALLAAAPAPALHYLSPAEFAPTITLPYPPARGSEIEKAELAQLHAIVASASPERLARAVWDDAHEDPQIFDDVLGVTLEQLPQTWALLKEVQEEADVTADVDKDAFGRERPWSVDPTLANCDAGKGKKSNRSYPSGHASLSYSVGYVLAQILPELAPPILARAADYAMSREICGVHYPSDTEASHVIGTLIASKLLANPAFREKLAPARTELRAALNLPG